MTLPHRLSFLLFFFFNDTATTEIYTLSLHDALPICSPSPTCQFPPAHNWPLTLRSEEHTSELQSRFGISYAVFCLKKKKKPCRCSRCGTIACCACAHGRPYGC